MRTKRAFGLKWLVALGAMLWLGLLMAPQAEAQFFGGQGGSVWISAVPTWMTNGTSTNFTLPGPTNATIGAVRIYNSRNVALTVSALSQGTNGSTAALSAAWYRSPDGTHWESSPFATVIGWVTTNGVVTATTNVDFGADQFICLGAVTNATLTGNNTTNILSGYSLKPGF
jgi:hypothetical protein